VEYFVEVFFFYGVLIGIAVWEVKKSYDSSEKQKKEIKDIQKFCKENEELVQRLQAEV